MGTVSILQHVLGLYEGYYNARTQWGRFAFSYTELFGGNGLDQHAASFGNKLAACDSGVLWHDVDVYAAEYTKGENRCQEPFCAEGEGDRGPIKGSGVNGT